MVTFKILFSVVQVENFPAHKMVSSGLSRRLEAEGVIISGQKNTPNETITFKATIPIEKEDEIEQLIQKHAEM